MALPGGIGRDPPPPKPDVAAKALSGLLRVQFDVNIPPEELTRFIRSNWKRLQVLTHAIGDEHG